MFEVAHIRQAGQGWDLSGQSGVVKVRGPAGSGYIYSRWEVGGRGGELWWRGSVGGSGGSGGERRKWGEREKGGEWRNSGGECKE